MRGRYGASDRSFPPILVVAGPTAGGKSGLALAVAEEFAGTIINADSMQLYRDLEVLTARPGPHDMARAPHRLYGMIDAAEACSAGQWRKMAVEEIARAREGGRLPVLVGGTGLYLRALLHGLAPVPAIPQTVREEARALHARLGAEAFRARLGERDPEAAQRLAPGDSQRLIRAYEVVVATGRPLAAWQRVQEPDAAQPAAILLLLPPRARLYAASDARFVSMLERGAVAEVERLLARGLDPALPAMKALGVRELAQFLSGCSSLEHAVKAAQQATRRYAKRQYTWFRHQLADAASLHRKVIAEQYSERFLPEILPFIRQFLLTVQDRLS